MYRQGRRIATQIGARGFFETSALLNEGVDDVFEAATRQALLVRTTEGSHAAGAGVKEGKTGGGKKNGDEGAGCCIVM